ncbi:pectate lyase [Sphingobium chungangianum]
MAGEIVPAGHIRRHPLPAGGELSMRAWGLPKAVALLLVIMPVAAEARTLEAFPGAVGYGRFTQGGRGGAIIAVTSLADSGPGTLRACIDSRGPRTCVFRVGGVIRWTTERPVIRNPYITIAGQTAPGGGILITHAGGRYGLTPLVAKNTHDVIIRHIRVRLDNRGDTRASDSGIIFEKSSNVIIDHVSVSWSEDETVGGQGQNDNITISNSILAEGLRRHDKCALLSSDATGSQKLTFIGNICAHNGDRNPDVNFFPGSCVDVVNNLIYNARSDFVEVWEQHGGSPVNIVGNYFKAGPNMVPGRYIIARQSVNSTGRAQIYEAGNYIDGRIVREPPPYVREAMVQTPSCPIGAPVIDARQAYHRALTTAGAFPRDTVDTRIVKEVRQGTGKIRHEPGILPEIADGTPYADSDGDGMSDQWEKANGTDATRNDAWEDANRDGWSNLDEFLDYAHRQALAGSSLAERQEDQDKPRTVTAWVVALTVAALAGLGGLLRAAMM